jgi:ATP-dependent DNA ligase
VVAGLQGLKTPSRFIIDGELVIEIDGALSFEALQMRLHPAASRIKRLSDEMPARLIAFDLLWAGNEEYASKAFGDRRAALEKLLPRRANPHLSLTESTTKASLAKRWLNGRLSETDGIVAKRLDLDYRFGERAMFKIKRQRTADCVVGGFRYRDAKSEIGSLLLGLYDSNGLLHHVGYTSAFSAPERAALVPKLEKLKAASSFTGDTPGRPSRWSTERSTAWTPVRPALVVEVSYDHATGGRFRHGTKLIRWRPDKKPSRCCLDQLD